MKLLKIGLFLACSSLACLPTRSPAAVTTAVAEPFRTDINPALLYWQALALMPDLNKEEEKHLFTTDWRKQPMDEQAGELAGRYNATFRLLRQAASSRATCDWGVDLSAGPEAMLPHLAKAKRCAQAASLRARWALQHRNQAAAREDLAATFVLARNLSRDRVLISCLVQIAMESIISGALAEQWQVLQPETIQALLVDFDNAPARGTVASCMLTEKVAFYDWFVRRIEQIQAQYPGDDQKALAALSEVLQGMASEDKEKKPDWVAQILNAAGNSTAGLLKYVREMEPFYARTEQIMALPYTQFEPAIARFQSEIDSHPNLLLHEFFPALLKARLREFRLLSRLDMVRAAYAHRLDPLNGLKQVQDPFGNGPFEYSRLVLEGVDRGFKLKSQLKMPDFDPVLIFVVKSGPAVYIDGPKAGQKLP